MRVGGVTGESEHPSPIVPFECFSSTPLATKNEERRMRRDHTAAIGIIVLLSSIFGTDEEIILQVPKLKWPRSRIRVCGEKR